MLEIPQGEGSGAFGVLCTVGAGWLAGWLCAVNVGWLSTASRGGRLLRGRAQVRQGYLLGFLHLAGGCMMSARALPTAL